MAEQFGTAVIAYILHMNLNSLFRIVIALIGGAASLQAAENRNPAGNSIPAHELKLGKFQWSVAIVSEAGTQLDFISKGVGILRNAETRIQLADGTTLNAKEGKWEDANTLVLQFPQSLAVRLRFELDKQGWLRLRTRIDNRGTASVALRQVELLADATVEAPKFGRVFSQSETMIGKTGIFKLAGTFESYPCAGFSDAAGSQALLIGFEKPSDAFYKIEVNATAAATRLSAVCPREDTALAPRGSLDISPLLVRFGESLSTLLDGYAARAASASGAKFQKAVMTGWCSWYHYYGNESADDILKNARLISESPLKGEVSVIQIDDGWNLPHKGDPRAWGDWMPGSKFPQGMKAVVDELHGLSFKAGLWLAPFSADKTSQLAATHPEWMVRANNSKTGLLEPVAQGNQFGLDLTNPEVLAWLRQTFNRVFQEWNFDYVKIDFLVQGTCRGIRHDPSKTAAEAFQMGMKVIRDCAGKSKFVLACGSPLGPAIGLCDGMRIGFDVGGRWEAPLNLNAWPHGNCSILPAAYPTLFRQWQNRVWWQNDPDCLVVRDQAVPFEVQHFAGFKSQFVAAGFGVAPSDFGLSRDEAEFWTRAVWLTGGMTLFSEVWPELSAERQNLIQRAFHPHSQTVKLLDYYEYPDVCVLKTTDAPLMVGLFNLSDEPRTVALPMNRLGGATIFREWLNGEKLLLQGELARFPVLAPHSARIWVAQSSGLMTKTRQKPESPQPNSQSKTKQPGKRNVITAAQ